MAIDPIAMEVLRVLAKRRLHITQCADVAGIDREVIGRWLRGERSIKLDKALRVLRVLDIRAITLEHADDAFRPTVPTGHKGTRKAGP